MLTLDFFLPIRRGKGMEGAEIDRSLWEVDRPPRSEQQIGVHPSATVHEVSVRALRISPLRSVDALTHLVGGWALAGTVIRCDGEIVRPAHGQTVHGR